MKIIVSLCVALLCPLFTLFGQFDNSLQSHVPNTPNASSFAKYAEVPVSLYSGSPNISIPIHSLIENKLSHQITLSYHASGIKASEVASNVGLGWNLNAGGVITRSVRGAPDEKLYNEQISGFLVDGVDEAWLNNSFEVSRIQEGKRDIESDLYFYNFAGYTGSFFFDNEGNVVQRDETDLIITPIHTGYSYNKLIWKITTPDGNVYHFGDNTISDGVTDDAVSYSQHYAQPKNMKGTPVRTNPLVDSWYLVEIASYDGNSKIEFVYDEYEAYTFRNLGTSAVLHVDSDGRNLVNVAGGSFASLNPVLASESLTPRLTEIKTTETSISLHYGSGQRRDLDHDFTTSFHPRYVVGVPSSKIKSATALDYIQVNSLSPVGCLTRFDFGQSYFTSPSTGFTETLGLTQRTDAFGSYYSDMRRLRLLNMSETSCTLTDAKVHSFGYNATSFQRRLTYGQDHWGYPNNQTGNSTLLPQLLIQGSASEVPKIDFNHLTSLANREPNASYTEQMMLKDITYPTGGKTTIDFEGHNYFTSNVVETGSNIVDLRNSNCSSPQPPSSCSTCCLAETLTSNVVTFDLSPTVRHEMRVTAIKTPNDNSSALIQVPIEIKRGNGNWQLFDEIILNSENNYEVVKCYSELLIQQGNITQYQFRMGADVVRKLFMQLLVKKYVRTNVFTNKEVGGLRVKTMTDDPIEGPSIVKNYTYTQSGNTNSSGQLIGVPTYLQDLPNDAQFSYNFNSTIYCTSVGYRFTSGNSFPQTTVNGSHMGYKRVEVAVSNDNGYTEQTFYDDPTYEAKFIRVFPVLPEYYIDHIAGQPEQTNVYKQDGSLLSSSVNTYSTFTYPITDKSYVSNGYNICSGQIFLFNSYTAPSKYVYLQKNVSTLDGVTTTTNFIHGDSNYPSLMTESNMTNSDGKVYKTKMYYAPQYINRVQVKQKMLEQNILLPAWKTEKYVDDVLIDGQRIRWHFFNPSGSVSESASYPSSLNIFPYYTARYESTWNENDVFQSGFWDIQNLFLTYNMDRGLPKQVYELGWDFTHDYTYSPSGKKLTHTYDNYVSSLTYYPDSDLPHTLTRKDGNSITYIYDGLLRLKQVKDNQRNVTIDFVYLYTNSPANRSYLEQTTTYPSLGFVGNVAVKTKSFVDGLGRNIQTLRVNQAPDPSQHILIKMEFDNKGRVVKEYESFAISGGTGFSSATTSEYTLKEYEPSPLNRIFKVTPPSWFPTTYEYEGMIFSDLVRKTASFNSYFSTNDLYKSKVTDGNGNITEVFTDKRNRNVLNRRTNSSGGSHNDTYTFYDDKERERYIIPPNTNGSSDVNRIFKKTHYADDQIQFNKVPDREKVEMRFDQRDLLSYIQDGERRNENKWYTIERDSYGRMIKEGFNTSASADNANNSATVVNVLKEDRYGTSGIEIDKVNYTKRYNLNSNTFLQNYLDYNSAGLLRTVQGDHLLDVGNVHSGFLKLNLYDSQDNVIWNYVSLEAGGKSYLYQPQFRFDHIGRLIEESIQLEEFNTFSLTATTPDPEGGKPSDIDDYFNQLQSLVTAQRIVTATHTYTNKDQLLTTTLGNNLQTIDYNYLPNGLLSSINNPNSLSNDLFAQNFAYNSPHAGSGATGRMNGDISSVQWKTTGTDLMTFGYTYDYLDRLTGSNDNGSKYTTAYGYDGRGNITSIYRKSKGSVLHDMTMTPQAGYNRVSTVSGVSSLQQGDEKVANKAMSTYAYDKNGAVITDPTRGATFTRNFLNLPNLIQKDGNNQIDYTYGADGALLRKLTKENGTDIEDRYYIDYFEFVGTELDIIKHDQGYIKRREIVNSSTVDINPTGVRTLDAIYCGRRIDTDQTIMRNARVEYHAQIDIDIMDFCTDLGTEMLAFTNSQATCATEDKYLIHWAIKDHLGNTRVIFDEDLNVRSEHHYYPFGLEMEGDWSSGNSFAYRYNGKEKELGLGLGYLNYGAREYDPVISRWLEIDPMAGKYANFSPYNYVANNPITRIDPDGMRIEVIGSDKYKSKVLFHLIRLAWNSSTGAQQVNQAIKSDKTFVIFEPKNNEYTREGDNLNTFSSWGSGSYESMGFDFNMAGSAYGAKDGENGKPIEGLIEATLAHELYHFNSDMNGNLVNQKGYQLQGNGKIGIGADEVGAVEVENMVRSDFGLTTKRTHYDGIHVYGMGVTKYKGGFKLVKKTGYGTKTKNWESIQYAKMGYSDGLRRNNANYRFFRKPIISPNYSTIWEY